MLWLLGSLLSVVTAEVGSYIEHNVTLEDVTGDAIVIHIVGHTHDDPGWNMKVDEYYIKEVQWIFYTIIPVLKDNPNRKFTYVEMAYMHRWWEEIDDDLKEDTVKLVNNGQFQLNLGGWCMNDEASPTASAVIHQMTDGNQFILSNLGISGRPTVGWHVDPFGHSWVTGGMWAQSGFDAFAVHRINYIDLDKRKNAQNLEFIWKGSTSLGADGYIFFHILDSGYGSPKEMNFWSGTSWINTDPLLPDYPPNQIQLGESLVSDARTRTNWYKHNQILIPFGSDFAHQNAYESMVQMDKLIDYINSNKTYNTTIKYSTLADYVGAVNDLNLSWSLEQPDFFTYVDSAHAWWSGYFTSRAYLKLYSRSRMNDLRMAEQLYLFAKNMHFKADYIGGMYNISFLRAAIDVTQHHDAITGTEKDYVAASYWNQLYNGTERVNHFVESFVGQFLRKSASNNTTPTLLRGYNTIPQLNANNFVVLVIYNSLPWNITEILQIPTNRSDLVVYNSDMYMIPSQINAVADQEKNSVYPTKYNLFILAQNIPPLSFQTFFIGVEGTTHRAVVGKVMEMKTGETFKAGTNGSYTITIDGTTNRLSSITNHYLGKTFPVEHQFSQYIPSGGIYNDGYIASGAYIFRPATDNRLRLSNNEKGDLQNKKQSVVFRQKLASNASPGFILQTHANTQQYSDTFNAIICGIDTANDTATFSYEYSRTDGTKWSQQPLLDFLVFDNNNPSYSQIISSQETGSLLVPKSSSSSLFVEIEFKTAFSNVPALMLSVRSKTCDGSQFVTMISNMTTTSAILSIGRIDSNTAWNDDVYLDYFAYDPSDVDESELLIVGETQVTLMSDTKTVTNVSITLDDKHNNFVVNEPIILLSIMNDNLDEFGNTYLYATTTYMNSNTSFGINLHPQNPSGNVSVQLSVGYIAFERIVLFENVSKDDEIGNVKISGPLLDEVQQTFKSGYGQTYRVFNIDNPDLRYIDNRVMIGPIDEGAEFITKYSTQLSTNNEYFTNQAALEYVKRVYYPYWDERIAANYYPSSSSSYIADIHDDIRFSTIVNQGHGVASLKEGAFEMMLQRRCLQDDSRGVGQVLNTTFHTEPQIRIIMDNDENTANLNRRYYLMQQYKSLLFFGLTDDIGSYTSQYNTSWSAIHPSIPNGLSSNIFLMQLRYGYSGSSVGQNGAIVLQLQHMFEANESSMATTTNVDISQVLNPKVLTLTSSTEMNLLATIPLANLHRLPWNVEMDNGEVITIRDNEYENKRRSMQSKADQSSNIVLKPRDIKTYVLNVVPDVPDTK